MHNGRLRRGLEAESPIAQSAQRIVEGQYLGEQCLVALQTTIQDVRVIHEDVS